jgi:MOSC domain-containing protein YiiM
MTKVGSIVSLFYSPKKGHTLTTELELSTKGIVGDKHYNKSMDRTILITSLDSYQLVKNNNIELLEGALGENILMDYNPYHLDTGNRLKINNVILEISQHCTLCKSFSKIDTKLPKLLKNDRGIFAKVIESGNIQSGDTIYLLD